MTELILYSQANAVPDSALLGSSVDAPNTCISQPPLPPPHSSPSTVPHIPSPTSHSHPPPSHSPTPYSNNVLAHTRTTEPRSLTSLASFFSSSPQKERDGEIVKALGVGRLTWLGRVTAARVLVHSLQMGQTQLEVLINTHHKQTMVQSTSTTSLG